MTTGLHLPVEALSPGDLFVVGTPRNPAMMLGYVNRLAGRCPHVVLEGMGRRIGILNPDGALLDAGGQPVGVEGNRCRVTSTGPWSPLERNILWIPALAVSREKLLSRAINRSVQVRTHVFTDGSARKSSPDLVHHDVGGWGYVVVRDGVETARGSGRLEGQVGAREAEITAAIEALSALPADQPIMLHADCLDVVHGLRRMELHDGLPPYFAKTRSREIWTLLAAAAAGRTIIPNWVKGHSGVEHNEAADRLACAACEQQLAPEAELAYAPDDIDTDAPCP